MKKSLFVIAAFVLIVISSSSCKKETVTKTVVVNDTVNITPSIMSLFTQKQWQNDTLYYNYTGVGTGTLEYARGGSSNILNEDDSRVEFWIDGNADAFDGAGNYVSWSWSFNSNDSTNLILITTGGVTHTKILKLDATHLTYYDSTNLALDVLTYKQ
jgi:hypothetical protein